MLTASITIKNGGFDFGYNANPREINFKGNVGIEGLGFYLLQNIYNLCNSGKDEYIIGKILRRPVINTESIISVNFMVEQNLSFNPNEFINPDCHNVKNLEYIASLPFLPDYLFLNEDRENGGENEEMMRRRRKMIDTFKDTNGVPIDEYSCSFEYLIELNNREIFMSCNNENYTVPESTILYLNQFNEWSKNLEKFGVRFWKVRFNF